MINSLSMEIYCTNIVYIYNIYTCIYGTVNSIFYMLS